MKRFAIRMNTQEEVNKLTGANMPRMTMYIMYYLFAIERSEDISRCQYSLLEFQIICHKIWQIFGLAYSFFYSRVCFVFDYFDADRCVL